MSYFRRYVAGPKNLAQWGAHMFAFGPEPETVAKWTCPKCRRRHPVSVKRCGCGR